MVNTVDWIEIRTGDIEKTAKFYKSLFGWTVIRKIDVNKTPYWIFDTHDIPRKENIKRGAFWLRPNERPGTIIYIIVDDINDKLQEVRELGGRVIEEKTEVEPKNFKAYIIDPCGNLLGLWEERE